ncbi:hypothetical protein LTR85_006011 [Meristemomyces frigidus]|nr:hypothetical protein LTR85_006011 [Meristemomyces frigidus]
MDSMRQMTTSLPRRRNDQPLDLLSDFRAAALSVTNLYKTAASAQVKARAAGYQDALDDILAFLDKENLGLMDGEGWKVRQWATGRLEDDGSVPGQKPAGSDDDEVVEKDEEAAGTRSSSPEVQRKTNLPTPSTELADDSSSHRRVESEPPTILPPTQLASGLAPAVPPLNDFTFRSNQAYPTNHDREATMDLDTSSTTASTPSSTETVRIIPRPARSRHANHNRQRERANGTSVNFNLGAGAGSKRKIPYPDFFDISGINFEGQDRRDESGGRGGKRGRHEQFETITSTFDKVLADVESNTVRCHCAPPSSNFRQARSCRISQTGFIISGDSVLIGMWPDFFNQAQKHQVEAKYRNATVFDSSE